MSSVTGYYGTTVAPQSTSTTPAQPQPVVVAVNNVTTNGSASVPSFNMDQYGPYAQQAANYAVKAVPFMPGAAAGKAIASAAGDAKMYRMKAAASRSMRTKANASANARGATFAGIKSAVKSSVLVGGLLSLATNGWQVYKKQEDVATAGANVSGDLVSSAVSGAAGAAVSSIGTMALTAVGLTAGLPLTLAGIALGIGGYMIADKFLRATPIFQKLTSGVHDLLAKAGL
jgi:hypothetical protein